MKKVSLIIFLLVLSIGFAKIYANPFFEDKYNIINVFDNLGKSRITTKDGKNISSQIQLEMQSSGWQWYAQENGALVDGYPRQEGNDWHVKMTLNDPGSGNQIILTQIWAPVEKGFLVTYIIEPQGKVTLNRGSVNVLLVGNSLSDRYLYVGDEKISLTASDIPNGNIEIGKFDEAIIESDSGFIRLTNLDPKLLGRITFYENWGMSLYLLFGEPIELEAGSQFSFSYTIQLDHMLNPPQNLQIGYDGLGVAKLTWEPAEGEPNPSYRVYRGGTADFPLVDDTLVGTTDGTEFVDAMDQNNKTSFYKVITWDPVYKYSSAPVLASIGSDNIPPEKPTLVETKSSGAIQLKWTPPEAHSLDGDLAASYRIYRAIGGGDFPQTPYCEINSEDAGFTNDPGSTMIWRDYEVAISQSYRYAIVAVDDSDNESVWEYTDSIVAQADNIKPERPEPPIGLESLGVDENSILGAVILSWVAPEAAEDDDLAEEYVIYRSLQEDPVGSWEKPGGARWVVPADSREPGSPQRFVDTEGIPGKSYYYAVVSLDKARNESLAALSAGSAVEVLVTYGSELVAPIAGAGVIDQMPSFSWKAPQEYSGDTIVGYHLQLAKDLNFTEDFWQSQLLTDTEFSYGSFLAVGKWYWRVKVIYQSDVTVFSKLGVFESVQTDEAKLQTAFVEVFPKIFNPTKSELTVNYVLQEDGYITVRLYDLRGRLIKVLLDNVFQMAKGEADLLQNHQLKWDGIANGIVPRGIYLLEVELKTAHNRPAKMITRFQVTR